MSWPSRQAMAKRGPRVQPTLLFARPRCAVRTAGRDRCAPSLWFWLALLLTPLSCHRGQPLAHLESLKPDVVVRAAGASADMPGAEQMALALNDIVKTQGQGEVDVVFAGNNRIHLGPNSSLLIERHGGENAEMGAVVLSGDVRVTAGGIGIGMGIRSSVGQVQLSGAKVSVLDVSMQRGIEVKLGDVALDPGANRPSVKVEVGQAVTLASIGAEGIVVSSLAPSADMAPMHFDVADAAYGRAERLHGQPRWQHHGQGDWQPVRGGTSFGNGDKVTLSADEAARIRLDKRVVVQLMGDNELHFHQARIDKNAQQFHYGLSHGHARLQAQRSRVDIKQTVDVADTPLAIDIGPQRADVELSQQGNLSEMTVRFGKVTLPDGTLVRGGQGATLQDGRLVAPVRDAFVGAVALSPGRSSVVFYTDRVPPVRFEAPAQATDVDTVRFSADRNIRRRLTEEHVTGGHFTSDEVKAGRTYWRVGGRGKPTQLDVVKEPQRAGERSGSETNLDDNGEATTIYYGNALPRVRLHWPRQSSADLYSVQLFTPGRSNTPLFRRTTRKNDVSVPSDKLREGSFVWRVVPIDAAGKPLTSAQDNSITLSHDAEVHGLVLRTPQPALRTTQSKVLAQGDVEAGCMLTLNGRAVPIDRRHQFSQTLPLVAGDNHFIFRLTKQGRPDRYYVRTIIKEP